MNARLTEVWLVRHTAVDVPVGTCYGRNDVAVAESFSAEAEAVRQLLEGEEFDAVFSSPLSRCVRLADACGHGDARRDDRLLELDFGEWEGRRFDEIDDPQLAVWYSDWLHARPTGGETFDEQHARVAEFLDELRVHKFRRVLVFTHGGVIAAAGIYAGLFSPCAAFSRPTSYGGLVKIFF